MQRKGNISILVLFVLLASSLLGVLTMTFVQSMMQQTLVLSSYYQSYYLAKAGLEFSLAQVPLRGVGFGYSVGSGSDLVKSNFLCASKGCDIVFALSGMSSLLSQNFWGTSGCEAPFLLSGDSSLLFPLFEDISSGGDQLGFVSGIQYTNLYASAQQANFFVAGTTPAAASVTFGILILSGEELYSQGMYFRTGSLDALGTFFQQFQQYVQSLGLTDFSSSLLTKSDLASRYRFYLMVSAPGVSQPLQFCLSVPNALPTQQYYIKSLGKYYDQMIGLEAVYRQPIPDFLLNISNNATSYQSSLSKN